MKKKPFTRLQELVLLRQNLAYSQLQEAHRLVTQYTTAIELAKEEYEETRKNGRDKINRFISDFSHSSNNGYPSKLSNLRALTAKVDYEIHQAGVKIEEARQNLAEAEDLLQERQQAYHEAMQKTEKINYLAKRFTEEELRNLNNIQEIDRLESGPGNSSNYMVR